MFRRTRTYRKLWYFRKRSARNLYLLSCILLASILTISVFVFMFKTSYPSFKEKCSETLKSECSNMLKDAAESIYYSSDTYKNIIIPVTDSNGYIISLNEDGMLKDSFCKFVANILNKKKSNASFGFSLKWGDLSGIKYLYNKGSDIQVKAVRTSDWSVNLNYKMDKIHNDRKKISVSIIAQAQFRCDTSGYKAEIPLQISVPVLNREEVTNS